MKTYQLVGIGNAVVDVISQCDDSFLEHMGIEKGIMQLIERDRGEVLYAAMQERVQTPGGSVANTIAGAGALGLEAAFIGRVHDDALGRFYAQAMTDDGVDFPLRHFDRNAVDGFHAAERKMRSHVRNGLEFITKRLENPEGTSRKEQTKEE